jgi:hypothetical protein
MEKFVVSDGPTITNRLRRISGSEPLVLGPSEGGETLSNATDMFRYIDHNFVRWNCDMFDPPAQQCAVQVYEMVRDSTLEDLFGEFGVALDSLALTKGQIKLFVKLYPSWLKTGGNGTFFLFSVYTEYFVAAIYYFCDGRLGVRVRRLSLERVFRAQKRHRLVSRVIGTAEKQTDGDF